MFATIRRYEGVGSTAVIALAVKEQFFPLFEKLPGFVSYTLVEIDDNTVMSVTIFETREQAAAGNAAVRELVQQTLSRVVPNPATIVLGKVMAHLDQWP
jgi:heme-degrading monooxygenase HmoA